MKILVCMKQVPQKDAPLKLNEAGTWIREDVSYEVNEPDAFALEAALRQKETHSGEVVVITAGPVRAQQVMREALAKGADRAILLAGSAGRSAIGDRQQYARNRAPVHSPENQGHGISGRRTRRNSQEAGGKTAQRRAGTVARYWEPRTMSLGTGFLKSKSETWIRTWT